MKTLTKIKIHIWLLNIAMVLAVLALISFWGSVIVLACYMALKLLGG